MELNKKILIIDKAIDRKKKISALKQAGYGVFPALKMQEARSRCRSGAYDLVVVNAGEEMQEAIDFCDELAARSQSVLLVVPADVRRPERNFVLQDDVEGLVSKVRSMFGADADTGSEGDREHARATA